MSNKAKGSRVERELIKLFTENSWRAIHVAGSGIGEDSPCDLIAAKLNKRAHAIEVKSTKKSTVYIKKEQIGDFILFSNLIGLKPVIALRFNYEGWLFLDPKHLKDTGKYWAVSLKTAKEKGRRFAQFFEREIRKKEQSPPDFNQIAEEILSQLEKEELPKDSNL